MKDGKFEKLSDSEVRVVLTENDIEICVLYVESEKNAQITLGDWKAGTLKLLRD